MVRGSTLLHEHRSGEENNMCVRYGWHDKSTVLCTQFVNRFFLSCWKWVMGARLLLMFFGVLTGDRCLLFQSQEMRIYIFFTKRGKRREMCIRSSNWNVIKLFFSYFLTVAKLNSKQKFKQNKTRNVKLRNTLFSHIGQLERFFL